MPLLRLHHFDRAQRRRGLSRLLLGGRRPGRPRRRRGSRWSKPGAQPYGGPGQLPGHGRLRRALHALRASPTVDRASKIAGPLNDPSTGREPRWEPPERTASWLPGLAWTTRSGFRRGVTDRPEQARTPVRESTDQEAGVRVHPCAPGHIWGRAVSGGLPRELRQSCSPDPCMPDDGDHDGTNDCGQDQDDGRNDGS